MQNDRITQNDDEQTVNLGDIFWKILMQWKPILLFSLIVGIAAAGIKYVPDIVSYRSEVKAARTQTSNTKKTTVKKSKYTDADIKQLQNRLSVSERNEVEQLVTSTKQVIADQNDYNNSLLMKIDPQKEHILYIDYYITGSSQENAAIICQTYQKLMYSNNNLSRISKAMNLSIKSKDLYKQMSGLLAVNYAVSQPGLTTDGKVTNSTYPQITVNLILPKSANLGNLVNIIKDMMTTITNDLTKSIGSYTLNYLDNYDRTIVNNDLKNQQDTTKNNILNSKTDIEKKLKNFSESQSALYNAETENLKAGMDISQSDTDSSISAAVPSAPKFPIQNFVIGFLVCLAVYVIIYIIAVLASRRLYYGDETADNSGLRKLGEYHSYDKTGFAAFVWSRGVYNFHYRKYLDIKEVSKYSANAINAAMTFQKNIADGTELSSDNKSLSENKNISILCLDTKSSNAKKFSDAVTIYLKSEGLNAESISQSTKKLLTDSKAIKSLSAVVLTVIEGSTTNKELDELCGLMSDYNIPVLGYMYVG